MFTGSMGLMEGKTVPELQQKFKDVSSFRHGR